MDNQTNPQPNPISPAPPVADGLNQNTAAALSYVLGFITGLFFFLTSKNKYVRFHAMQSTVLSIILTVISYVLGYLPLLGAMLSPLVSLASLILWIVMIIKAYKGEKYKLPYIGNFAEKQA